MNQPRYVDCTRPQALMLRELGIECGVSNVSDGDHAGRTEKSAEPDGENTVVGATVTSDQFRLYKVKAYELSTRIARYYGFNAGQLVRDNKLYKDQLAEKDTILFIRNPKTATANRGIHGRTERSIRSHEEP